jgi:serine/threonine protein kinase
VVTLKGKTDSYFFDPSDKRSILRANGKFGSTYVGKRGSDGIKVVIKQLDAVLAKDEKAVARFIRESKGVNDLDGSLKVLDQITEGNDHFLVREYFPGSDLLAYSRAEKMNASMTISLMVKVCAVLRDLHKKEIIHRDIRPANILVGFPEVKLIDLGLARFPGDDPSEKSPFALIYSPPEQVMNCGAAVNTSSDIYSLALTIYECMSGTVPFQHNNPEMLMQLMINVPIQPHKRIPAPVFAVLQKAASKFKFLLPPNKYKKEELLKLILKGQEQRYFSVDEFALDLMEAGLKERPSFFKRLFGGKG